MKKLIALRENKFLQWHYLNELEKVKQLSRRFIELCQEWPLIDSKGKRRLLRIDNLLEVEIKDTYRMIHG